MTRTGKIGILVAATLASAALPLFMPPVPQDPAFHRFADTRSWLGIANFGNVMSNVFFLAAAVWGWIELAKRPAGPGIHLIYGLLFTGIFLTGIGSAYYHLHPDSDRLIWDRIPMTIVFMSLLAATVAEWVSQRAGVWLLLPLVALAIHSGDPGQQIIVSPW